MIIWLKHEKIPDFPFKPKINHAGTINYIIKNKDLKFDSKAKKEKKKKEYNEKIAKLCTFQPEINDPEILYKIFEKSPYKNNLSVKDKPKKVFDSCSNLKSAINQNGNNLDGNQYKKILDAVRNKIENLG